MKALVKKYAKPGLWLDDVARPEPEDDQVLIRVKKTSICGTDIHIYDWDEWAQKTVPVPLVIGHEFFGEIAAIGNKVKGFSIGQRVSGEGHLICGYCRNCREGQRHLCSNVAGVGYHQPGCFAEYFVLPATNVFPVPDSVSDDAASLFDPFGNAVHTALTYPLTTEDVLITGAGPIGLMTLAVALRAGAHRVVVTDINPYRLELAKKMGATEVINVAKEDAYKRIKEMGMTDGFTVGLEMSGNSQALDMMIDLCAAGGKIALLGILPQGTGIDWNKVIFKMLTLKGIYGREIFRTWYQMVRLIEHGLDLEPLISHRLPYKQFEDGFEVMKAGKSIKVVLDWES